MQLDHVNNGYDQKALRDFLVAPLGLTAGPRPPFEVPGYWLYLDGRPVVHTWLKTTPPGPGWVDHVAFGPCGEAAAQRQRLGALGFPFRETLLPGTETVQFFVTGPEGIKIELQCPPL